MKKISTLKKITLRTVWSREDKDFTPWLNKNLDILGEAIGLDLSEVSETEKTIEDSNKRIDILASTTEGEIVIIENQLKKSDDKHLGQILVYMISEKSNIGVWIVEEAKAEHKKIINYLNKKLEGKFFYLIELSAYQIGNSEPAPQFQVICKPEIDLDNPSENKKLNKNQELKIEFWSRFLKKAEGKTKFFDNDYTHWWTARCLDFPLLKGLSVGCLANQNKTGVSFISNKPEIKDQLLSIKESLKESLGFDFEPKDKRIVFGKESKQEGFIKWLNSGGYKSDKKEWDKILDDLINNFVKLEQALNSLLKNSKHIKEAS